MKGTERQICPGLPETGPCSPDWRPEAPPAAAAAKGRPAAGGATAAGQLIGCPARVTAACPAGSASCHLLTAVGRGVPAAPSTPPIPPALGSSASQGAGQTPTVRCKKEPLTSVPTHCQVAKPPVHPSSWDLPAHLLSDAPRSPGARVPAQLSPHSHPGAWAKSPGCPGGHAHSSPRLTQIDWDTVSSGAAPNVDERSHHATWARLLPSRKQVWGEGEAMTAALHEALLLVFGGVFSQAIILQTFAEQPTVLKQLSPICAK